MELIASGFFSLGERDRYRPILDGLRYSRSLHGLRRLSTATWRARPRPPSVYRDAREWSRRALFNIAGSSRFSSDATIRQYASEIWGLSPVKTDFGLLGERP